MERSLDEARLAPWRRLLPPVAVAREGQELHVNVHVPHGSAVSVWIVAEDGSRHEATQRDNWDAPVDVDGVLTGRATFAVPDRVPLGWHTLLADNEGTVARCPLIVTPRRLHTTEALAGRRNWGLTAQLYSVRSSRSWGIGDLADLADLAAITGQEGAGFLLVNPLHAAEPRPPVEDSPYLPTTRRFFNPLYLRVEEIPEYGYLGPGRPGRGGAAGQPTALRQPLHRAAGPELQLRGQTGRPGAGVRRSARPRPRARVR